MLFCSWALRFDSRVGFLVGWSELADTESFLLVAVLDFRVPGVLADD